MSRAVPADAPEPATAGPAAVEPAAAGSAAVEPAAVEPVAGVVEQLVGWLVEQLPGADPVRLVEQVDARRAPDWQVARMLEFVRAHPDALTSGRADVPAGMTGLLTVLAADHPGVAVTRCGGCDRTRRLSYRRDGLLVCGQCYTRTRPAIECPGCGQRRPPVGRADGALLCGTCYQRAGSRQQLCAGCRRLRPVAYRIEGQPFCRTCGPRRTAVCRECGRHRPVHVELEHDGGPLCATCYRRRQRRAARPVCRDCGRVGGFITDRRCCRCDRLHQVDQLLRGPDGGIHPQLEPLRGWFAAQDSNWVLSWLSNRSAPALGGLAAAGTEFTHEVFDAFPHRSTGPRLRRLLVDAGVLSRRAPGDLDATAGAWLDRLLAEHPRHATILQAYAQWAVLRRARSRAATASAARYARARITQAAYFLAWLDEQDLALAEVTQGHVDAWVAAGASTRHRLRDFLTWTHARGLTPPLEVAWLGRRGAPAQILGDDDRWRLLRRCLTDDELPLRLRVAGALVLLYGQRPTRIARLTVADYTGQDIVEASDDRDGVDGDGVDGDGVDGTGVDKRVENAVGRSYLRLSRQPVLLPPRLANLVDQLAHQARPRPDGPAWLFPGRASSVHPLGAGRLTLLLNHHLELSVRAGRGGALCDLAADLPASVVAHLLGMNISTATRWSEAAKHNWAAYIADRAADATSAATAAAPAGTDHGRECHTRQA